jgi:hypothetical protein
VCCFTRRYNCPCRDRHTQEGEIWIGHDVRPDLS